MLAVVLAAGGTGGGVYFLTRPAAEHAEAGKQQGKTEGKKGEPKAPAVYVTFDPPFVVNFEAKGMMRFLQVTVGIMTRDPARPTADQGQRPARAQRPAADPRQPDLRDDQHARGQGRAAQALPRDACATIVEDEGGDAKKVEALYFTCFVMQ